MVVHHYANAPITEAIIDLRVSSREGASLAELRILGDDLVKEYPERKDVKVSELEGVFGERVLASASSQHTGFLFTSQDGKQIFQSRMDGFTFSRLAPYEDWERFRSEAQRLWTHYREHFRPEQVTRLAVRYVNRIDVPGTSIELKDYFRTSPEVSPDLPQAMEGFFLQLRLPQDDIRSHLLINQTIIPPSIPNIVSVVLDFDLFRDAEVPNEEPAIWEFFEQLHVRKNQVFEACITDRTRELIQ